MLSEDRFGINARNGAGRGRSGHPWRGGSRAERASHPDRNVRPVADQPVDAPGEQPPHVRLWVREIMAVLYITSNRNLLNLIADFQRNPPLRR